MLKISLLGAFNVLAEGQPLTGFVSNKVRALLAYLAIESGRPHSRESLTGLLWADFPQNSAQGNLRYALSNLHKLVDFPGTGLLTITRQSVQFNLVSNVWVDAVAFQDLLASGGSLEEAVSLFRGEFLEGLSIADSSQFEEWRSVRREQFHRQVLIALHALVDALIARGDYSPAMQFGWRQLELEPWNEDAYQQMMRALALSGQRDAALSLFERCRSSLSQELDVEPSIETIKLFKDIQEGRLIGTAQEISSGMRTIPSNVPEPLASFIGRENELVEIEALLALPLGEKSKHPIRLLSLVGAGGCGKTRLANELARRLSSSRSFSNGIWWIDLTRLSDPTQVPEAVAAVFNLREIHGMPLVNSLTEYLRSKKMLLILDNCEHLIDACAQFAEKILLACPQISILATSREPLDVYGERVFQVNPLTIPKATSFSSLEDLLEYDSVHLFLDRGETASPGFILTSENAAAIGKVCQQLDGIPLALELAARQLKTMSVEQIAARLEDRFNLLTNGFRTALPHHRTLRAMLDWTYDFLSESERSLFQQLSIFSGSWTQDAAENIIPGDICNLLNALVNRSLVTAEFAGRYHMLETIRQYGLEKLADTGKEYSVRARHCEFFLDFAEQSRVGLRNKDQKLWMQKTRFDYQNLLSALEWSLQSSEWSAKGLRLAVALTEFWERTNYYRDEQQWLERALASVDATCPVDLLGWANLRLAACSFSLGDFGKLTSTLDVAEAIFNRLEDSEGLGLVKLGRGAVASEQEDDLEAALSFVKESMEILESINDKWDLAEAVRCTGYEYLQQRDLSKAHEFLEKAASLARETGNMVSLAMTLYQLGQAVFEEGDISSAESILLEARTLAREMDDRGSEMDILTALGMISRGKSDLKRAKLFYEQGLFLAKEMGARNGIAAFLSALGFVSLDEADTRKSVELFTESLQYYQEQDIHQGMAGCYFGLASVAATLGDMEKAARLLGRTGTLIKIEDPWYVTRGWKDYNSLAAKIKASLKAEDYEAAWREGNRDVLEGTLSA